MSRKTSAIVLSLMLVLLLAGCGDNTEKADDAAPAGTTEEVKSEHPKAEHPHGGEADSVAVKSEHPKSEHPN
jgi:hypothetical protein